MDSASPYQQLRQLEFFVQSIRPADDAGYPAMKAFDALLRHVRAAENTLRDYELFEAEADTKAQLRTLPRAIKSLEGARASLLKASEYELIGAVDVAQYSAGIDELISRLQ